MTETSKLLRAAYTKFTNVGFRNTKAVCQMFQYIEAEYLEQSGVNAKHAALTGALEKAVADYGKPGGPWNVPGEPGTWLQMARDALEKVK